MNHQSDDNSTVRKKNQALILKTIFSSRVISRAELAKRLNMSKPAVNEHIEYLLSLGIIQEVGEGVSNVKGGRKPILISPNEAYGYMIAIDLNFNHPIVSLSNILGDPIDKLMIQKRIDDVGAKEAIQASIEALLQKNRIDTQRIHVIVVASPGTISKNSNSIIFNSQVVDRVKIDIKSYLQQLYDIPVIVKNDVDMAALGEAKFLCDEKNPNLLFVSFGPGMGAAVILDGKLHEGENNSAGEIALMIFSETGERLEMDLSAASLVNALRKRLEGSEVACDLRQRADDFTFDDIVEAYTIQDAVVREEVRRISRLIGVIISNSVALLDIGTVVIGGEYIVFEEVLIAEIKSVMEQSPLVFKPRITLTTLAYEGGTIGCFDVGRDYIIQHLTKRKEEER